jgi:hypothetical protein
VEGERQCQAVVYILECLLVEAVARRASWLVEVAEHMAKMLVEEVVVVEHTGLMLEVEVEVEARASKQVGGEVVECRLKSSVEGEELHCTCGRVS